MPFSIDRHGGRPARVVVELGGRADAARGVYTRQTAGDARGAERRRGLGYRCDALFPFSAEPPKRADNRGARAPDTAAANARASERSAASADDNASGHAPISHAYFERRPRGEGRAQRRRPSRGTSAAALTALSFAANRSRQPRQRRRFADRVARCPRRERLRRGGVPRRRRAGEIARQRRVARTAERCAVPPAPVQRAAAREPDPADRRAAFPLALVG